MPRLKRRGNTPRFRSDFHRRMWQTVQDLHRQREENPAGPFVAPKTLAGIFGVRQFRQEVSAEIVRKR